MLVLNRSGTRPSHPCYIVYGELPLPHSKPISQRCLSMDMGGDILNIAKGANPSPSVVLSQNKRLIFLPAISSLQPRQRSPSTPITLSLSLRVEIPTAPISSSLILPCAADDLSQHLIPHRLLMSCCREKNEPR